jgi:hypothetical protein
MKPGFVSLPTTSVLLIEMTHHQMSPITNSQRPPLHAVELLSVVLYPTPLLLLPLQSAQSRRMLHDLALWRIEVERPVWRDGAKALGLCNMYVGYLLVPSLRLEVLPGVPAEMRGKR